MAQVARKFDRKVQIESGRVNLTNEQVDIEGVIPFSDTWKDDVSRINILNLDRSTISQFGESDSIKISGGYEGDVGILFEGIIRNMSTNEEDGERITKLQLGTGTSFFLDTLVSQTYGGTVRPERILRDILQGIPQIEEGRFDSTGGIDYQHHTISRSAFAEVEGLVRDFRGFRAYIREFQLFFETAQRFVPGRRAIISADTGLRTIDRGFNRRRAEEVLEIRSLLERNIFTGGTIQITGSNADGVYRVIYGRHDLTNHTTVAEVVEVPAETQL